MSKNCKKTVKYVENFKNTDKKYRKTIKHIEKPTKFSQNYQQTAKNFKNYQERPKIVI